MGHSHEAGFLTQAYAHDPSSSLPLVSEGLAALYKLTRYAHIKLDRSSLKTRRLIDPANLEKYMVHFESRVLPLVVRDGFLGEPKFSHEEYQPYEDHICDWPATIPYLKKLYGAFPEVVQNLDVIDHLIRNEAAWKAAVRQRMSPADIEAILDKNRKNYVSQPYQFEYFAEPS